MVLTYMTQIIILHKDKETLFTVLMSDVFSGLYIYLLQVEYVDHAVQKAGCGQIKHLASAFYDHRWWTHVFFSAPGSCQAQAPAAHHSRRRVAV